MPDFIQTLETKEIIEKLQKLGYSDTVDVFLLRENECYTKKGRLNKSGACRALGCKPKQLDDMFAAMKKILAQDLDDDDDD